MALLPIPETIILPLDDRILVIREEKFSLIFRARFFSENNSFSMVCLPILRIEGLRGSLTLLSFFCKITKKEPMINVFCQRRY